MIHGSAGIDHLLGGDGGDWIVGNGGADHIEGGLGNDYISGIGANGLVDGGDGNDILSAYGSDWIIIQTPNSPISADVFWADAASVLFNPGSSVYTDSNNDPTFEYGAFPVNASYSGTSSLGGGWTYQFTVANGVWDAKYFHPQTAPDGIKPAAYWEQRIQGQLLTESVFLQGGAGGDLLIGNNGSDVLDGGTGQDNLFGIDGDDISMVGQKPTSSRAATVLTCSSAARARTPCLAKRETTSCWAAAKTMHWLAEPGMMCSTAAQVPTYSKAAQATTPI
jgi:Ca2+-binding RTX toxin-like protein